MERIDKTVSGRIIFAVLVIHVFVIPLLYFAVVFLVKQSNEELFLNNVRTHSRFVADSLERLDGIYSSAIVIDILDSVVVSGDGVYATLSNSEQFWASSLIDGESGAQYREDFAFGQHDDGTYFLSVPVVMDKIEFNLRLGFDEAPVDDANHQAYLRGAIILAVYLAVVLALVAYIGRRVMRPIKALQISSRNIASGQLGEHLVVDTNLVEFVALARDLELMRNHLIGINIQLQKEIRQKEESETERQQLEHQLRHRQRLETVGTLAGGIAHELNNIMVPILLYSESAMDDLPEGHAARDDLTRVMRAASRARSIVRQVLTFSRQMGSVDVHPVNVAVVVKESLDLIRASFAPTAQLRMDIDDNCPLVLGNSSLLGQVVINLCTNAYQSLKNGVGTISVVLKKELVNINQPQGAQGLVEGVYAKLIVEDSGEGMDKQTMERVFEPFFTTRKVGEGTGLGLSVVHGIISNMEGDISVMSNPDIGTTFVVYIPALDSQDLAA